MSDHEYPLGFDFHSCSRLNMQHLVWLRLQGYLVHPSIDVAKLHLIAEMGTGTGGWVLDLARQLPETTALDGFDVDLRQSPHPQWTPRNVTFKRLDVYDPIPQQLLGRYDLVHLRFFICVVRNHDPAELLASMKSLLRPGGYIQWTEMDSYTMRLVKASPEIQAPATEALSDRLLKAIHERAGKRPGWVSALQQTFEACGLEAVEIDRRVMADSDLATWHDNALLSLEEMSASADDGAEINRLLKVAGKESAENRRGLAITGDSVTVIGRLPAE